MSQQVANWNRRARQLGLQHDLTVTQWIENLDHFEWKCVYCVGPVQTMDHYYPLAIQGDDPILTGTTAGNCLPCCWACNQRKGSNHPIYWSAFCDSERLAVITHFIEQHAERKRVQVAFIEHFNLRWGRRWQILERFQQYAAAQIEQGFQEFWEWAIILEIALPTYETDLTVPALFQELQQKLEQANDAQVLTRYQAAIHFLNELVEEIDPEHVTLEK